MTKILNFTLSGLNTEKWDLPKEIMSRRELENKLKTANVHFYIEGATRDQSTLICELGDSYVQQSQRYVHADNYSIERLQNENIYIEADNLIKKSISLYERMTKKKDENKKGRLTKDDFVYGIPYEDARYILPLAMKTNISVSMSADKLIDLFTLFYDYETIFYGWIDQFRKLIDFEDEDIIESIAFIARSESNSSEKNCNDFYSDYFDNIKPNQILNIDVFNDISDVVFGGLTSTSQNPIDQINSMDYSEYGAFVDRVAYGYGHMGITEQSRNTCGMCLSLSAYHQYIRHRLNNNYREDFISIATDSTRGFYMPKTIRECSEFVDEYYDLVNEYFKFLIQNSTKYDIQFLTPMLLNCMYVKFVSSSNARNDAYIFRERLCMNAQEEIRTLIDMKYQLLREVSPDIYNKAVPPCVYGSCKEGKLSCGKAEEMRKKYKHE